MSEMIPEISSTGTEAVIHMCASTHKCTSLNDIESGLLYQVLR